MTAKHDEYRSWLWKSIREKNLPLLQALNDLAHGRRPATRISRLVPRPYARLHSITKRAAEYVARHDLFTKAVEEHQGTTPTHDPGAYILYFGQYSGQTIRDIQLENPGYLDWLLSQSWVHKGTRKAISKYLGQPSVKNEIEAKFEDYDFRCGGNLTTTEVFIPSLQKSKRFSLGKPEFLPVGYDPEDDRQHRPRALRPAQAWELAADLLQAIEDCDCIERLPELAHGGRGEVVFEFLEAVQLREAYKAKRDQVSLLALLPDWKHRAALDVMEAIQEAGHERAEAWTPDGPLTSRELAKDDETTQIIPVSPDLEAIAREQAPELMDVVDLLQLQGV